MTEVLVDQPLASPKSAKKSIGLLLIAKAHQDLDKGNSLIFVVQLIFGFFIVLANSPMKVASYVVSEKFI